MSRANTELKAEHVYICGNTGTGKSSYIKKRIKTAPRVVVFDPDDEYSELPGFVRVESAREFIKLLRTNPKNKQKIAFVADGPKAFAVWAKAVFNWGQCLAVAEEIADVTSPAKAPPDWGKLIRRGRKYGIVICAVTQRPAEADKTILSNAAIIRTCALGRDADRVAVAREIQVSPEAIATMIPLDWMEFHRADLSLVKGNLRKKSTENLRGKSR